MERVGLHAQHRAGQHREVLVFDTLRAIIVTVVACVDVDVEIIVKVHRCRMAVHGFLQELQRRLFVRGQLAVFLVSTKTMNRKKNQ